MDACRKWRGYHGTLLACLWLAPVAVLAVEPPAQPIAGVAGSGADSASGSAAGFGRALADEALMGLRGGEDTVLVSVANQGEVSGNTATDVVSGGNHIDGGAFASASGLLTVIQNSGANVLIQNGTSINVHFGDPVP